MQSLCTIIRSCCLLRGDHTTILSGVGLKGLFQLFNPFLKNLFLEAHLLQRLRQSLLVVHPTVVQIILFPQDIVVFSQRLDPCLQQLLPGCILIDGCGVLESGLDSNLLSSVHLLYLQLHGIEILVQLTHIYQCLLVGSLVVFKLLPGCIKLLLPLRLFRILRVLLGPVHRRVQFQLELGILLQLLIQEFLVPDAGLLLHLDCISAHLDVVLPHLIAHLYLSSLGELLLLPLVQGWCCSLCGHFNIREFPFGSFSCCSFDHRCWCNDQQSSWSFVHLHRLLLLHYLLCNLLVLIFVLVFFSRLLLFDDLDIDIGWSFVSCTSVWFLLI